MYTKYLLVLFLLLASSLWSQTALELSSITAQPSNEAVVGLNVKNFNNIGAFTVRINYNSENLTFISAENWNVQVSTDIQFNSNASTITFAWAKTAGVSLGDSKLVDLRFIYKGGNAALTFNKLVSEIADKMGNVISTSYVDGLISAAANPVLSVPNGGEQWYSGSNHNINWTYSGGTNVKLDYSTDNGLAWNNITNSTPAGSGSYPWSLPKIKPKVLYLKSGNPSAWTTQGAQASQYQEINHWVNAGCIVETFDLTTTDITAQLLSNYNIVRLNGIGPHPISADEGTAVYNWVRAGGHLFAEIPFNSEASAFANFGIEGISGQQGGGTGLEWFYHGAPLRITQVNGPVLPVGTLAVECMDRPVLKPGHSLTIDAVYDGYPAVAHGEFGSGKAVFILTAAWSHDATPAGNAYRSDIFKENNLQFLDNVIHYVAGNINFSRNQCKVRISNSSDLSQKDESDGAFSILSQFIKITSPGPGQVWAKGVSKNITWQSGGNSDLKIEYSTDNGINWLNIASAIPASDGQYNWSLPDISASELRIKITSLSDPNIYDISEKVSFNNLFNNIDELFSNAKLILKVESGAAVNTSAMLTGNPSYKKTSEDNFVYWEKELNEFNRLQDPLWNGMAGLNSSIRIITAVNTSGVIYAGTFGENLSEHLSVFTGKEIGISNYLNFNNTMLEQSVYGDPQDYSCSNDIRQNRLAHIIGKEFIRLKNGGYFTGGPQNFSDLYNCSFALKNNTADKIVTIKSFLVNHQMDYPWFDEAGRPVGNKNNFIWSPIGKHPDQDCAIGRSFSMSYVNALHSSVLIETGTDNGMNSTIIIAGLNNPPDFSSNGGSDGSWKITYNAQNNSYVLENSNCASAAVELRNQYPTAVAMMGTTTWSGYGQTIAAAIFGDDIITSDHIEGPLQSDDNNPQPMKLVLLPGWNRHYL